MSTRSLSAAAAAIAIAITPAARAQDTVAPTPMEGYLRERGLLELLAVHLADLLSRASAEERTAIAERLGSLYVELLESATTPAERTRWESRSTELLRDVPEASSYDLRLNLAKVRFLRAEDTAERSRVLLATDEEVRDAASALRAVKPIFDEIGSQTHRRVEFLEGRLRAGVNEEQTERYLAEARRLRSIAMFYAGWTDYYLALIERRPASAEQALRSFGWLLGASGGRPASVDRVQVSSVRWPHVARAAIGAAMCESLRGNDATALRWLDLLDESGELDPLVERQLPARRLMVLAQGRRWADVDALVRILRGARTSQTPLEPGVARLLAVLALAAMEESGVAPRAKELVQGLAEGALSDLVERGDARAVLDIVSRFGTAPLSGEGFIVNYVRGLQAFDRARALHHQSGEPPTEPATADATINAYRDAAAALAVAGGTAEPDRFVAERADAGLREGQARFFASDFDTASRVLEHVASFAPPERAEEALWLAIVSLDKAVERGAAHHGPRLQGLAAVYLRQFPRTDRAATLLIRQTVGGAIPADRAIAILLEVPRDSPLYESARRHAAGLLYAQFARATGRDRQFAALQFAQVAGEILESEERRVREAPADQAIELAERTVLWARRILDAVTSLEAPDAARARAAIDAIDRVSAYAGLDVSGLEAEIAYRRLLVALAVGTDAQIESLVERLHQLGDPYSEYADRRLYLRAASRWDPTAPNERVARDVVRFGHAIIRRSGEGQGLGEASIYALHERVSSAAAVLWQTGKDRVMLELALRLDRALMERGRPTASLLRRFARLSEDAGDMDSALESWRTLLAGLGVGAEGWYEARYEGLRLLAARDGARAREVMDQHKALHPDYGPPPWGDRLRELDGRIPPAVGGGR